MGVDIFGLNPKSEKGEYFRSNWWHWRPIWLFTIILCPDLLDREYEMVIQHEDGSEEKIVYKGYEAGMTNDGLQIPADVAEEIGRRILEVLKEPEDEIKRIAEGIKGSKYDVIAEKVMSMLDRNYYHLDREFLKKWAEFCLECGGFEVC